MSAVPFKLAREVERFPGTLLAICALLIGISLVVLQSASLTPDGGARPFVVRQLIWAGAGLIAFLFNVLGAKT